MGVSCLLALRGATPTGTQCSLSLLLRLCQGLVLPGVPGPPTISHTCELFLACLSLRHKCLYGGHRAVLPWGPPALHPHPSFPLCLTHFSGVALGAPLRAGGSLA